MRSLSRFVFCAVLVLLPLLSAGVCAQAQVAASSKDDEVQELRQTVRDLALRVAVLEERLNQRQTVVNAPAADGAVGPTASSSLSNAVVAEADATPMPVVAANPAATALVAVNSQSATAA